MMQEQKMKIQTRLPTITTGIDYNQKLILKIFHFEKPYTIRSLVIFFLEFYFNRCNRSEKIQCYLGRDESEKKSFSEKKKHSIEVDN